MRILLLTYLFLFIFGQISAQEDSVISKNNTKILVELEALSDQIAAVKLQIESGAIRNTDELYEMNYKLQGYLDNISEQIYQRNLNEAEMSDEDIEMELDKDEENYKSDMDFSPEFKSKMMKSLNDFSLVLGWGINGLNQGNINDIMTRIWGSNNWELGFVNKKQLGRSKSRIVYGLLWNTHNFKLDKQNFIASYSATEYEVSEDNTFDKVKFGIRYLQIPLGLGIKFGKNSEIYFGGHAGVRLKSFTRKEFKSEFGEDVEQEAEYDYGMRKFNYGLDISFGVNKLNVFGKYDINPVFDKGPEKNIYTVGLRVGY